MNFANSYSKNGVIKTNCWVVGCLQKCPIHSLKTTPVENEYIVAKRLLLLPH